MAVNVTPVVRPYNNVNLYSHITRLRKTKTFLLSLSASSELTEIKTFTRINIECANLGASVCMSYPLARLQGLKQKYSQHCEVTNTQVGCGI